MIDATSVALDVPFRVDGTGRIMVTRSLSREIAVRLESVIGTTPGERVMRPGYGAGARGHLYEVNNELSASILTGRIQDEINAWEPAVTVEKIEVDQLDYMAGMLSIRVDYRLRSTGEVQTAVIGVSPTTTYGWPS